MVRVINFLWFSKVPEVELVIQLVFITAGLYDSLLYNIRRGWEKDAGVLTIFKHQHVTFNGRKFTKQCEALFFGATCQELINLGRP